MLNSQQQRELCYLVTIDDIQPIPGKDRVECAVVGGWTIMVQRNVFKPGDIGIYFEVDSKVPETDTFKFLESKHYKIKTQKYKTDKGYFWSQGLLMHPADFGWKNAVIKLNDKETPYVIGNNGKLYFIEDESRFLTTELGVKYASDEDNARKKTTVTDKYKKMAQRNGKLFSHQPYRWLMKRTWGKKFLFIFFGKQKDKTDWPSWVKKTDEERVQNMPWILKDKNEWIATEKIDGTSTTFTIKRGNIFKKNEFFVCSRNVVFNKPDKNCFYDTNVYLEMAEKYHIENVLTQMLKDFPKAEWITIQGETYGAGIQKRDYSIKNHDFKAFNLIMSYTGRWNSCDMKNELEEKFNIPCVPILNEHFILPDTVEELLNYATNNSTLDNKMREGIVFRSKDGSQSFKAVSNEYLIKYHG